MPAALKEPAMTPPFVPGYVDESAWDLKHDLDGKRSGTDTSLDSGRSLGYLMSVNDEDLDNINFRILSSSEKPSQTPFLVPKSMPVPLLFLREIFTELRIESEARAIGQGEIQAGAEVLPFEAFQRAFERLFFLLCEPGSFVASTYDANSDGWVTWVEFFSVYSRRAISLNLSWAERIYFTLDNPDMSILGQVLSLLVLLAIMISSCCFILSTVPSFQVHFDDGREPAPSAALDVIEQICLYLFVVEYGVRLCTSWDARTEIFDRARLKQLVIGFQPISTTHPLQRVVSFMLAPSNLVDLAAILPGIVALQGQGGEGGGFVVLRLIRLTRIFRAFKNQALVAPIVVIARTLQRSTKALNVLLCQLVLGVVIFGSLIYSAEQGTWDPDLRQFMRPISRVFNETTNEFTTIMAPSPFTSIPASFWWAMVTVSTVGYGDDVPTTLIGCFIATLTIIFSIVVLTLPVGVLGGTFNQCWQAYDEEIRSANAIQKAELRFITSAMQRLDPSSMCRLMLIEVWHDHPDKAKDLSRPAPARFMGEAVLKLNLPADQPMTCQTTLRLEQNVELVQRTVSGSITIKYQWTPDAAGHEQDGGFYLKGTLDLTLVSANGLINLDWRKQASKQTFGSSNPYCMVFCYPDAPGDGPVRPCAWRAPTHMGTVNPRWNQTRRFNYNWCDLCQEEPDLEDLYREMAASRVTRPEAAPRQMDALLSSARELISEVKQVRSELDALHQRVDARASPESIDE